MTTGTNTRLSATGFPDFLQNPEPAQNGRRALHLIFQMNALPIEAGGRIYELDWIYSVVCAGLNRPVHLHLESNVKMNDSLTVLLFDPPTPDWFLDMRNEGIVNFGALHMGDETFSLNRDWYSAGPDYIFRNYYNGEISQQGPAVHYLPLGMKSGFGTIPASMLPRADTRKYLCNFIGSKRGNRQEMLTVVEQSGLACFISADKQWADPQALHVITYRNLLVESVFTLAPHGNNPESLRLYEALEAGSIPIVQSVADRNMDFLGIGLGPNPIPTVAHWSELPELIHNLTASPEKLLTLQRDVISWWQHRKRGIQAMVRSIVDSSFERVHGDGA
ncbi:uncharacterized protein EV422DRAFT_571534 [Fimicolochytrium jonesii]|uniref:uncharacterized protein n=1 Tax=Fimicolochytrium jonesii TaxID=1396493 RepID=UPI0022FE961E|nr:uncharacterized protein EV422DRAFT_571534 [Fimicolochytrium jonesii]KAI8816559.1 hypothetical protein EV422DRAFT_571534 [Fimicolochytrium jonesii]